MYIISCIPSGNVLIDSLVQKWYGKEFDSDGIIVSL